MTRWFLAVLAGFACLLSSSFAHASRVSPMVVELDPTGSGSIARIDLVNDALRDIPFEVQMMRGEITPEGKLTLTPADDQFVVFPAQALVESNSQQVFRIQYVGEGALDRSEVYYMAIRQIPVAFEPGVTQVQMVVNYNVLVNVVPPDSKAEPTVIAARPSSKPLPTASEPAAPEAPASEQVAEAAVPEPEIAMQHGIEVEVGNLGNRYYLAGLENWSISGAKLDGSPVSLEYSGDEAARIIGMGVVAPEATRIFFFPLEAELDPSSVRVDIGS
jgi:fimbrial chaperone protein